MQPVLLRYPLVMVQPRWSVEQGRLLPTRLWPALTPGLALRLVLAALAIVLILWLFVACAAGRPTSLIRLPEGTRCWRRTARPRRSCANGSR